jgi:hypothetical protein
MKRSSTIALSFSSVALLFGMGGIVSPSAIIPHKPTIRNVPASPMAMTSGGLTPAVAAARREPLTVLARPAKDTPRFDIVDFRKLPGGDEFEAMSLNERGDILGLVLEPNRAPEGPGMAYVSNRVQMIAAPRWSVFRQNRFVTVADTAPEGSLHTAAQNDRGQVVIMTGPRGRRGRIAPEPGDIRFQLWENGVVKPLPIADDVRQAMQREVTTGMLALNNRVQIIISAGRNVLAWDSGHVEPVNLRYILGFNNSGFAVGNPVTFDPQTGRVEVGVKPVLSEVSNGRSAPVETGQDVIFDLNDRNEMLCSVRNSVLGVDRDRFYLFTNGKQVPLGVVGGAMTARVNNRGQAVLGKYLVDHGKVYDLEALVPPKSPWKLQYVMDINDRGEILIRAFHVTERVPRSVLLRPRTAPVAPSLAEARKKPRIAVASR